jgi:formylmethanofuran dehydrogenase subunit E
MKEIEEELATCESCGEAVEYIDVCVEWGIIICESCGDDLLAEDEEEED